MTERRPPTLEPAGPAGLTGTPSSKPPLIKPLPPKIPLGPPPGHRPSRWRWLWLPVLILLGLVAWFYGPKASSLISTSSGAPGKEGKKGGGKVPVVAAKATRGN